MFPETDVQKLYQQIRYYKSGCAGYDINIDGLSIENLNNLLPYGLMGLSCSNTKIRVIDGFPSSLQSLKCRNTFYLEAIERLPINLAHLDCGKSTVKKLCELPQNLRVLIIDGTNIKMLPNLPMLLEELNCSNNHISKIESLPLNLSILNVSNTLINSLPRLPSFLKTLNCSNTRISKLEHLPTYLTELNILNTYIVKLDFIPLNIQKITCSAKFIDDNFDDLPNTFMYFGCSCCGRDYIPTNCLYCYYQKLNCTFEAAFIQWKELLTIERVKRRNEVFKQELFMRTENASDSIECC